MDAKASLTYPQCGAHWPVELLRSSVSRRSSWEEVRSSRLTYLERLDLADDFLALLRERLKQEFNLFVVVIGARLVLQFRRQVHVGEILVCQSWRRHQSLVSTSCPMRGKG